MIATLGNYQIIREIGRGGMGVVYEALDSRLDRRVAIKTIDLPHDDSVSPEAYEELVARFQTEAKAIAKLSHPNIVTIYDYGQTEDGRQYMVQELLQGRSLAQMLQTYAPLPIDLVIKASIQACQALDYAHDAGIIHRDVKPGNMILLDIGTLKLMDFGIARLETGSAGMTKAGNILGSLLYISPEQLINAGKVDRRADIYSLGVSIYEMLTGRLPYGGDNIGELVMAIMQSVPGRPSQINPQVLQPLEDIILRAMSKEADKRFARASEMAQALNQLSGFGGGTGPRVGGATQIGGSSSIAMAGTEECDP
ncbi:MAG: serine/threonine protein kinase, partial [Candidatus Sericytochromatia bacterium]|nr:serine/threonine protein kinase [Candidatus Sericytochromatia bacterium]